MGVGSVGSVRELTERKVSPGAFARLNDAGSEPRTREREKKREKEGEREMDRQWCGDRSKRDKSRYYGPRARLPAQKFVRRFNGGISR